MIFITVLNSIYLLLDFYHNINIQNPNIVDYYFRLYNLTIWVLITISARESKINSV